jgi:MerR family mercuric resistance operon transcriptional regulator
MARDFSIGELGARAHVNVETIRYYERIGLMPEPPRSESGRRRYADEHLRRLRFIRRGRELGFSLDEIRSLLGLADVPASCAEVFAIANRHLGEVRAKIADLKRLERTLSRTAQECTRDETPHCPIIDALHAA